MKYLKPNELLKSRNSLNAGQARSGTIVGIGNPIINALIAFTLFDNALLNTVQSALNTTKRTFMMIPTFAWESVCFNPGTPLSSNEGFGKLA